MSKETEIAKLRSISTNSNGDVFATFQVVDKDYEDYVLRWASQDESGIIIRGDSLYIKEKKGKMRTAPGKEV